MFERTRKQTALFVALALMFSACDAPTPPPPRSYQAPREKTDAEMRQEEEARRQAMVEARRQEEEARRQAIIEAKRKNQLDAILTKVSQNWLLQNYDPGSVRNVQAVERGGRVVRLSGNYSYNQGTQDWVEVEFDHQPEPCIRYTTYDGYCKSFSFSAQALFGVAIGAVVVGAIISGSGSSSKSGNRDTSICRSSCASAASSCESSNISNRYYASGSSATVAGLASASIKNCRAERSTCESSCR